MFKKLFNTKDSGKKSYGNSSVSYVESLTNAFSYNSGSRHFTNLYLENAPVFTATKKITNKLSAIDFYVKDKNGDFVDHPILELLNNPSPFTSGRLFKEEISSFYLLTGNYYIEIIRSSVRNGQPSELKVLRPSNITVNSSPKDGYPESYSYINFNGVQEKYKRDGSRYINNMGNELIHCRNFNPDSNLTGASFFAGCQLEISQYALASIHNNSLLKNQARPSGLLTYKGDDILGDDQINRIKEELQNKFRGAANAGASGFLSGKFDWIQLSESVKDMDFAQLKKSTSLAVYSALDIPLPLVSPDHMTMSNMDEAKYMLYDDAVIPLLGSIIDFLNNNLMILYKDSDKYTLSYDQATITPLEERKFKNANSVFASGLITRNEGRDLIGKEAEPGGDLFYQPSTLVPVGQDTYTEDNRDKPAGKSTQKDEYIRIMSEAKNQDGGPRYNKEDIEEKANTYFRNAKLRD